MHAYEHISIFLVQYLHSKNLARQLTSPFSGVIMTLAALIFADDADSHALNSGSDAAEELVVKAQRLLDT